MSRAISRLVVSISSIFAFGYFSCDAYVDFSSIEKKYGVSFSNLAINFVMITSKMRGMLKHIYLTVTMVRD